LNRKEVIFVTFVLLLAFVGGAFADTIPTSQTRATVQTTGVDVEVLRLVPGIAYGAPASVISGVIIIGTSTFHQNLTSSFTFAPNRGFNQVNSVLFTLVFSGGNVNSGDQLSVRLNQGTTTMVSPIDTSIPQTIVGQLSPGNLHVSSNTIDIGVASGVPTAGSSYQLFEVRLTVEYIFLA
jgi:hypothetical protein